MPDNMDDAKGKVKEAAGDLTGDKDLKNEGKADQAVGKLKELADDAKDAAENVKDKLTGK